MLGLRSADCGLFLSSNGNLILVADAYGKWQGVKMKQQFTWSWQFQSEISWYFHFRPVWSGEHQLAQVIVPNEPNQLFRLDYNVPRRKGWRSTCRQPILALKFWSFFFAERKFVPKSYSLQSPKSRTKREFDNAWNAQCLDYILAVCSKRSTII